ncbi:MAG: tripartite tricarboxylate transporter substrate binding protein [Xanthobacteraceae bacterium]
MDTLRTLCAGVAALVMLGATDAASAQGWPTRSVTVVVPFVSGTTDEFVARIVLGPVSQALGQPFNFENRTGGDGTVGVEAVVKANPDGQTLLLSSSAMISAVILHQTLPYDVRHDLEPIAMFGGEPTMLVGAPNKGYANIGDLVAAAKAKPGELKFASVGIGSPSYLAGERFRLAAGLDVKHVAYAGPGQALADLNAGRVDFYFIPVLPALPLISEGRAVPLAVSTPNRLQSLRGLPTLDEAGYPIGQYLEWCGLSAPANTPRDVVDKLNGAIVKALDLPAVHSQLLRAGFEPAPMSADQFVTFVANDLGAMKKLAHNAQIQPLN